MEPRCEVVGTVGDGRALLEAAAKLQPDIVVVDIGMPGLNGLDAARQLQHTLPKIKLIFMTMNEDPYLVGEAFRALRAPGSREHAPEPTPRQREVIQLLAEGRSMKEVASALKITTRTVAAHKYGVMKLLQLKTNADLVQYAIKHRIISI